MLTCNITLVNHWHWSNEQHDEYEIKQNIKILYDQQINERILKVIYEVNVNGQ